MARSIRLLAALVIAPLAGAIAGSLVSGLAAEATTPGAAATIFKFNFLHWYPWIVGVSYLTTMTVGLGFHAIARRREWRRFSTYWIAGGVLAGIIVLISGVTTGEFRALSDAISDSIEFLIAAVPAGVATAGVAWLIRRPDRNVANPTTATT